MLKTDNILHRECRDHCSLPLICINVGLTQTRNQESTNSCIEYKLGFSSYRTYLSTSRLECFIDGI